MWDPEHGEERASGSEFSPEVDIWSLGVITYYMITGRVLFSGRNDLLAYYRGEAGLPVDHSLGNNASIEVSDFLEKALAATPVNRPTARELLDHVWLAPLLQASDPEEQEQNSSTAESINPVLPQMQRDQRQQAAVIPRTSGPANQIAPRASDLSRQRLPPPQSEGDTYKQLVAPPTPLMNQVPSSLSPRPGSSSLGTSEYNDFESGTQSSRALHAREVTQFPGSNMPPADSLPLYTRRRSDTAPIPILGLTDNTPTAGSPTSSVTSNSERLSGKLRRVSQDIVPKRSRRSQDQKKAKYVVCP